MLLYVFMCLAMYGAGGGERHAQQPDIPVTVRTWEGKCGYNPIYQSQCEPERVSGVTTRYTNCHSANLRVWVGLQLDIPVTVRTWEGKWGYKTDERESPQEA